VPLDLDLTMGGTSNLLYTGNLNLGAPGESYGFFKVGSGTLALTGTNSSYYGYLDVQDGTFEVSAGGKLAVTGASVSDAVFINGNLVATGAGSTFAVENFDSNSLNYMIVGRDTTAPTSVTVDNGGQLTTGASAVGEGIGYAQSSQITAKVDGAGSIWDFGAGFMMGAAAGGTASLTVSNGGIVRSTIWGNISIGRGGEGIATVTDDGSRLSTDDSLAVGELFNGNAGAGTLVIENGGSVTVGQAHIGVGGTGTVSVRAGSQLQAGGFLGIGEASQDYMAARVGNGQLTIEDGGLVVADNVWIGVDNGILSGSGGTLTVLGTAGNRGVLETASLMRGYDSAAALFDGGILRATANTSDVGAPLIGSFRDPFIVHIGARGMSVDTQTYDVTVATVLADNDTLTPGFLNKQGTGRLVLTADNTYSAGTIISSGTLQLGAGGTSGWIVGDVTDNGTLAFNRSDIKTFDGTIAGAGGIHQIGTGQTILTADSSALTGISQVQNGILSVNGILGGFMEVRGGRLQGVGKVGGTTNFAGGTIAPGNSIGTLTVAGDYVGNGGRLEIETVLGDDSSATDKLVVTGNTSGNTNVQVINVDGAGAQTSEGIRIVDVAGTSDGNFVLLGSYTFKGDPAVVAGAYAYRLYQGGVSIPTDGDWYLRSALLDPGSPETPLYQPGAPIYEAYAGVLQSFNELDTLQQRLGNRSWSDAAAAANTPPNADGARGGIWGRVLGRYAGIDPKNSTTGVSYGASIWQLQAGADGQLYSGEEGDLVGGLSARYGTISADVSSIFGDGSISGTGYGLGGSMTWYGKTGFYLDAQANVTWYDSDLSSSTAGASLISGNDALGYAFGLEAGQKIALGANWSVTPQAQLTYSSVDYGDFTDAFGSTVSLMDTHNLRARLGISADYENSWADEIGRTRRLHVYGITNLYHNFMSDVDVRLSGVELMSEQEALWGGFGLGGTYNWDDDKYAFYGEATVDTSLGNFGDSYTLTARLGLNIRF
jgi:fibronectin-binding autotransporter adhesin